MKYSSSHRSAARCKPCCPCVHTAPAKINEANTYAKVKIAINKITKEKFAIKIYEREKLNSNSKKSCVYKEIQIMKKLNHKNIIKKSK